MNKEHKLLTKHEIYPLKLKKHIDRGIQGRKMILEIVNSSTNILIIIVI